MVLPVTTLSTRTLVDLHMHDASLGRGGSMQSGWLLLGAAAMKLGLRGCCRLHATAVNPEWLWLCQVPLTGCTLPAVLSTPAVACRSMLPAVKSVVNLSREDLLRAVDEGKRAAWAKLSAIQVPLTCHASTAACGGAVSRHLWAQPAALVLRRSGQLHVRRGAAGGT